MIQRNKLGMLAGVWICLADCSGSRPQTFPVSEAPCEAVNELPRLDPAQIDSTLLLVGDAGNVRPTKDPVMQALLYEAGRLRPSNDPSRMAIVFLGDNIYPSGMPLRNEGAERERALAVLRAQAEVALQSGVQAFFVPGNHDWKTGGGFWGTVNGFLRIGRYGAVFREAQALDSMEAEAGQKDGKIDQERLELLPHGGRPGPETRDLGDRLQLVFLDTNWWLIREHDRPTPETPAEVLRLLDSVLARSGGRTAVLLAHHPIQSHGPHGQRRPLSSQDLKSSEYQALIQALEGVLAKYHPFLYAAGHDHSLQVLRGRSTQYAVVSGSASESTKVGRQEDSCWSDPENGFLRIDFLREGRFPHAGEALVQAIRPCKPVEACKDTAVERPFSAWLKPSPSTSRP